MLRRESIAAELGKGSRVLACAALLSGCGVFDYQLGKIPASGGTGSTTSISGAAGTTGGSQAGGSAGASGITGGAAGTTGTATGVIGWASVSDCGPLGTIGGETGPTVRPQTAEDLDNAVRATGPSVVEISGSITLNDVIPQISSDKTLVGVNGAELVGSVRVRDARNVILRNIRFNGGGGSSSLDAVEVDNSTCVWIDHCEFVDGGDSNLDIVRGSDLVTVSWSKFYYVVKTDTHRLGSVCGNSNSDTPGKINITFHHDWWAPGVLLNMPSVRHGKVHIFNNYFSAASTNYCIGAGYMSKLLVQNNYFDGSTNPIIFNSDEDTAEVVETGNDYSTATGDHVTRGASFEPPYQYQNSLESAETAKASVASGAGRK